jgi:hypothetical protein
MKLNVKSVKAKTNSVPVGNTVLLVEGAKGSAYRLAHSLGGGRFQLVQNNLGFPYRGAILDLSKLNKMDKQTRLEVGSYIAGRGSLVKITPLSVKDALSRAKFDAEVLRKHAGPKKAHSVHIRAVALDTQYVASIETFATGKQHFFQTESKYIAGKNEKHYGALKSSKELKPANKGKVVAPKKH